jgi:metal-sulfur cluster biosynthetic enzyme
VPGELTKRVTERINEVIDEETNRRLGELNVITEVSETGTGSVKIKFQPTSAYSPIAVDTGRNIRNAAMTVDGVQAVRVECSGHMMDDLVNKLVNQENSVRNVAK